MQEDNEGFLYPVVDKSRCINCSLCEKVCPVINQYGEHTPIRAYAAINTNEDTRLNSSSGGVFFLLAERAISYKGVVFGAGFEKDGTVVHSYTETLEGISLFQGSKYVQSRIGNTYKEAENFLKQGRYVLYTGTPCQIAGLRHFLRKDYEKLLTVDFICHGVPSSGIWRKYLQEEVARLCGKNSVSLSSNPPLSEQDVLLEGISFRDKRLGWKKYSFALTLSKATAAGEKNTISLSHKYSENPFMKGFLSNVYLRPSCYACPSKCSKSGSDITLADFWNVHRVIDGFDDDKGTSLVLTNTERGENAMEGLQQLRKEEVNFNAAIRYNSAYHSAAPMPKGRRSFYSELSQDGMLIDLLEEMLRVTPRQRVLLFIRRVVNKIKRTIIR